MVTRIGSKKLGYVVFTLMAIVMCLSNAYCQDASSLIITEFMASNDTTLADGNGEYSDWLEIYNPTSSNVSLASCYLTDDASESTKWAFSSSAQVPANGYLVVFASGNAEDDEDCIDSLGYIHTSFKLSAGGESLALIDSDGVSVIYAYWDFPEQGPDISYGLSSDGSIGFLDTPTPGAANTDTGGGYVSDTKFSVDRGFFTEAFTVELTTETEGASIRYTTDGSTPSETNGTLYSSPLTISETTVLRALAYKSGWTPTDVDTQTYIFLADIITQPATKPTTDWPDPTTGTNPRPGDQSTQAMDYAMDTKVTNDSRYEDLIDDALLAIPSISIVTDLDYLFDSSTGIYSNAGQDLECPASVELLFPDGTKGFQVNTGLKIRGGSSATASNPKHSFRIVMRSDYGDSKIDYKIFGDEGAKKFDKMDFRTAQNYSWQNGTSATANWLDDPFSRVTMRDMNHPYTRGFFFHLYLDGVYWGLYQTEERPEAYFAQSYLGGDEEDYDAIKADQDTGEMYTTDGTMTLYNEFWTQVNAGISTTAAYYRLQGKNPDGSDNASYTCYLDVDNFIDYMLVVFFTGAQDTPLGPPNLQSRPRNLNIIGNHTEMDGFKYIMHDNEWSLLQQSGVNVNRVSASLVSALSTQKYFNPWWLHLRLKTNSEYVMHFADRVQKHFFNSGALTPETCTERYQALIDEIDLAIIAESARWGDYKSSNDPRTRDDDWLPAVNWVKNDFFNASPSTRTDIVLAQLKAAGLFPSIAAPVFSQHGGEVDADFDLQIHTSVGTVYYTTNGSDPRLAGGSILSTAQSGSSDLIVRLSESTKVKARAYSGGSWSALAEAEFTITQTPVRAVWQVF